MSEHLSEDLITDMCMGEVTEDQLSPGSGKHLSECQACREKLRIARLLVANCGAALRETILTNEEIESGWQNLLARIRASEVDKP